MSAAATTRKRQRDDATTTATTTAAAVKAPRTVAAKAPKPPPTDDAKGHYILHMGTDLNARYKLIRLRGEGTYGRVVECYDRAQQRNVAIKIIRNIPQYRRAAMFEIQVLERLRREDPQRLFGCVKMESWFDHCNHICMVFDLHDKSIFDFLKDNQYRPFPMLQVQAFAKQLVRAVAFLHSLQYIHTDLKPENILLMDSSYSTTSDQTDARTLLDTQICLIDFGSSVSAIGHHSNVVCTRHYRAPEIILGLGWSYPCDMWSIGCVLMELYRGETLFQTHENIEHLAMMERVFGPVPQRMHRGVEASKFFTPAGALRFPDGTTTPKSERRVERMRPLDEYFGPSALEQSLADLVKKLLIYEPSERLTAQQVLAHPFIAGGPEPMTPPSDTSPQPAVVDAVAAAVAAAIPQQQASAV